MNAPTQRRLALSIAVGIHALAIALLFQGFATRVPAPSSQPLWAVIIQEPAEQSAPEPVPPTPAPDTPPDPVARTPDITSAAEPTPLPPVTPQVQPTPPAPPPQPNAAPAAYAGSPDLPAVSFIPALQIPLPASREPNQTAPDCKSPKDGIGAGQQDPNCPR